MGEYKKALNQLSAAKVAKVAEAGFYPDGGGLGLKVTKTGSKSWILRFMLNRKAREMGLGPYPTISVARARELAITYRSMVAAGQDPIEVRKAAEDVPATAPKRMTFDGCAAAYIKAHRPSWKNEKHADQWTNTLATYASPVFGSMPVDEVDTDAVMAVLKPIWLSKTETATRVRGRIENVLDWATVMKHRSGDNPARWRGHLSQLLPEKNKVAPVVHQPALPYQRIAAFMADLRSRGHVSAEALEFTILTAARASEAVEAVPSEFDIDKNIWTVPAARMKGKVEHRVALCNRAVAIAKKRIQAIESGEVESAYLFPGTKKGASLTTAALLELGQGMGYGHITTHGFRSTFRDWAAECTEWAGEVVEKALAHTVRNKVESAYRRGDLLERRAGLMREWEEYCAKPVTD